MFTLRRKKNKKEGGENMLSLKLMGFVQNRYKVIAVVCLVIGIALVGATIVLAGEPSISEMTSVVDKIIDILGGPIGKLLAAIAFIVAGISLFTGKFGVAGAAFLGGILFAFAKTLAGALGFGETE